MVDWHYKTDFQRQKNIWFLPFFDLFSYIMDQKNAPSQKSYWHTKSVFYARQPREEIFDIFTPMLYFRTFLSELQIAPTIPNCGISVQNLVQGLLRTYYWLIRLKFRIPVIVELYYWAPFVWICKLFQQDITY